MKGLFTSIVGCILMVSISAQSQTIPTQRPDDAWLAKLLMEKLPDSLKQVLVNGETYGLQVLYTRIDRINQHKRRFTNASVGLGRGYHYPASTVKLPAAVLALEKINRLAIPGLNRETTLQIEPLRPGEAPVLYDSSAPDNRATIAHYIKKILLVSDNDAYNRLYEFVGQQAFNERLHQLGMPEAQIIHRLEISLSESENRATNAFRFLDNAGNIIYEQASATSQLAYAQRTDRLGKGYMRYANGNSQLIEEPLDFSKKNRWPLAYHHQLVQWIMFPETQPIGHELLLTDDDYAFLRQYMSMYPSESKLPVYADTTAYWDSYVKFLFYGSEPKAIMKPTLRIYNKVGDAYGHLIDGAYFEDAKNGIRFMLSVVVYCNSDGILNDNTYDYDQLGFPFMKAIGQIIYQYEASRIITIRP